MKRIFLILSLVSLSLVAAGTSSGQPDKKTLTKKIMERSGINDQIRQFPLIASSILTQSKDKLRPEVFSALEREIAKAWDPERLLRGISDRVEKDLDIKTMEEVLTWLDSDLGKKITAVEKANTTPGVMQAIEEYGNSLKKTPPPKKRIDLVQRLIEAEGSVKSIVDMKTSMTIAMLTAINPSLPKEKQADLNAIRKQLEQLRPKIEEETRAEEMQGKFYIYRTLKDEELQPYVEFAESESGKRYNTVTIGAFTDGMERGSSDFGKVVGELIKKMSPVSGKVVLNMKDGATFRWSNYTEKDSQYCTWRGGGELCIRKNEVASIEPDE